MESRQLSGTDSSYRVELARKAIHLCSLSIPIVYFFISKNAALQIIIPVTAVFAIVDVSRLYLKPVQDWFIRIFGWMLRKHESDASKKRLNGATYVLISATICILIFPKIITITSFAILIIGDLSAALIGKRIGKRRFFDKTLEGSLAFFLSSVIVILLTPKINYLPGEYLIGFAAAAIGAFIEALPIEIDDNLSVPLSVGAVMWLMYYLALPALNLYQFG